MTKTDIDTWADAYIHKLDADGWDRARTWVTPGGMCPEPFLPGDSQARNTAAARALLRARDRVIAGLRRHRFGEDSDCSACGAYGPYEENSACVPGRLLVLVSTAERGTVPFEPIESRLLQALENAGLVTVGERFVHETPLGHECAAELRRREEAGNA